MKLLIDFQIKNGKQIISRDTKGYKVVLNRIVKKFQSISNSNYKDEITYKVIIQMSKEASWNNNKIYSYTLGRIYYSKNTIVIYYRNCLKSSIWKKADVMDSILETLAHEFGHLYDWLDSPKRYNKSNTIIKEKYADDFSRKIVKRKLISESKTGKAKYSRKK